MTRRIGYVQLAPALGDVAGNLRRIGELCGGLRADLLVLPEPATTGYTLPTREAASRSAPAGGCTTPLP